MAINTNPYISGSMGCKKITYQNFTFLEVIHRKKVTDLQKNGLNGDHLGNVRLSYTDYNGQLEIVEENNYYPFGLKHMGYNSFLSTEGNDVAQRWKFGGKEYQEDMELDWYDVTARNYDPALGRWMNIDPLAETMRRHSPYSYAFDNPIFFMDVDGMAPSDGYSTVSPTSSSYTSSNYNLLDQNGNVLRTVSEEDFNEKMLANNFSNTRNKRQGHSGNGENGGSVQGGSPTNTPCKTNDCYSAYFKAQALSLDEQIKYLKTGHEYSKDNAKSLMALSTTAEVGLISLRVYAIDYRKSLPILEKVGLRDNLRLIRYTGSFSKIAGGVSTAVGVYSAGATAADFGSGQITGGQFTWRMTSSLAPLYIGLTYGQIPGAAAGALFMGGEWLYDQGVELLDLINRSFTFDFTNSGNILNGFNPRR